MGKFNKEDPSPANPVYAGFFKKYGLDLLALFLLTVLTWIFYYPESDITHSRYAYYYDAFERAATSVNPDYDNFYARYLWEEHSPFQTLAARHSLSFFKNDISAAMTPVYFGTAMLAAVLTFSANRIYFAAIPAFLITVLILFDRTLLPISHGLGLTQTLLLIPAAIFAIHHLALLQNNIEGRFKKYRSIAIVTASLALIYLLGGHEMFYGFFLFFAFAIILSVLWIIDFIRKFKKILGTTPGKDISTLMAAWGKRRPFGLTSGTGLALLLAMAVGIFILMATHSGIAGPQANIYRGGGTKNILDIITYKYFFRSAREDIVKEPIMALVKQNKLQVLRGTFVEGRYLTEFGKHHENTFLYPGKGFNGIIPLFLLPGMVIGLYILLKEFYLLAFSTSVPPPITKKYFLVFNISLLALFFITMALTYDPKPTRYTFFIYPIIAASIIGYTTVFKFFLKMAGRPSEIPQTSKNNTLSIYSFVFIIIAVILSLYFGGGRLIKNYKDLQSYYKTYKYQIPLNILNPVLKRIEIEPDSRRIFVAANLDMGSIGLAYKFKKWFPDNVTLYKDYKYAKRMAPKGSLLIVYNPKNQSFYYEDK